MTAENNSPVEPVAEPQAPIEPVPTEAPLAEEPIEPTAPEQRQGGFKVSSEVKVQFKQVAEDGTETVTTLDEKAARNALRGIVVLIVGITALGIAIIWWIFQL